MPVRIGQHKLVSAAICTSLGLAMVAVGGTTAGATTTPAVHYDLSVLAGTGTSGAPTPGRATSSRLDSPYAVARDSSGNTYIADEDAHVVEKVDPAGQLSIFAGDGGVAAPTSGRATQVSIVNPWGVNTDAAGDVYVADDYSGVVDKITPNGQLTIVAGNQDRGDACVAPAPDQQATTFDITSPGNVAVAPNGSMYIADWECNLVYKVSTSGVISIFAGNGDYAGPVVPGQATSSPFEYPWGMVFNPAGDMYLADWYGHQVVKITPAGTLSVVAGTGVGDPAVPGPAADSPLDYPGQVTLDSAGNLYIADESNYRIERVDPAGNLTFVAGTGANAPATAGPATQSAMGYPYGLTSDARGDLFIADGTYGDVYKLTASTTAPSAPTHLTGARGKQSVRLSFTTPESNGGVAITGYQYTLDNGRTWHHLAATTSGSTAHATVSGVPATKAYAIAVRAVNAVGAGPASNTAHGKAQVVSTRSWYHDPLTHAQRRHLAKVPAHPKRSHGHLRDTTAVYRSRHGLVAPPARRAEGHQLKAHQAVQLTLFAFNSAKLTAAGRKHVALLAKSLRQVSAVTCEGNADYAGSHAHEATLAARRAHAVCAELRHVAPRLHVTSVGYAYSRPAQIGGSARGRVLNRRVDVVVKH